MEEYLSQIYAILEPSQMTALQEYLPLDSPGSVTVHQVAAALTAINAPTVAMNAVHSFCEKHGIPVDWLDDSQEADGVDQRAEIAGAANSIVSKPSEEQTEGAMRINTCTEGGLSTEHVPVGEQPQAPFTTQTGRAAPPKISTHAQESAKGSNIPATFHSYLRATTVGIKRGDGVTEAMEFKYDVMRQLDELFKSKPSALGIFIPFVSPKGFEQREDLPSLVDGAEELKKAFSFLGHAVFKLKPNVDLESWQLKAALEGIAAMVSKCPASFQQICIYFTGHGGENVVYTPDGAVLLTSFTDPFCTAPAPQDDPLPKVFIFDTCNFGVKNILQDSIAAVNTICVFASIPGNRAFAKENGCGLLTSHLAKAIQTIGKPFSLVVADAAEEVRKEINKHPEYGVVEPAECQPLVCQASRPLNLLENRRKAMTPEIQIELHPTAVCVKVSFTPSASHFNLTGCCVQCEGPNGIEQCKQLSLPGTNQVCIDGLSPGKESRLKAVAKYVPDGFPEEEVSSEEERVRIRPEVMPTVERGPTRTSVLVTSPRLHQQYNMQSLSLKYWAEDEGEEHAQSVDVEFEADQEQVDLTTQREKTCKVKAVAMYAFPPGSEVSSPILTIHREGNHFWKDHRKVIGALLLLLFLLFPLLSLASALIYNGKTSEAPVMELGYQGDMIFMDEVDSSRQKLISVQECQIPGDYLHYPSVYLVNSRQDNLMLHDSVCNYNEPGYHVRHHKCVVIPDSGQAPPAYLMWGSEISAYICLSSVNRSTESHPAYAYISKAQDLEDLEDCPSDVSNQKPYKTLKIGSNNRSVCTWLNFSVKESDSPGYYKPYLVLPGQVFIMFNISFRIKYLNRTDYEEDVTCSVISEMDPCPVSIPGGLNRKHYAVMVYIPDLEYDGNNTLSGVQPTTHVCMSGKRFLGMEWFIGGMTYAGLFTLFLFIVSLFLIRFLYRRHRTRDYEEIPS